MLLACVSKITRSVTLEDKQSSTVMCIDKLSTEFSKHAFAVLFHESNTWPCAPPSIHRMRCSIGRGMRLAPGVSSTG